MRKLMTIVFAMLIVVLLSACSGQKSLDGVYIATGLPSTEDTLIEAVSISGDTITMSGKNAAQTLNYKIQGNRLVFETKYGTFSYPINVEEGRIVIDGIAYIKQ